MGSRDGHLGSLPVPRCEYYDRGRGLWLVAGWQGGHPTDMANLAVVLWWVALPSAPVSFPTRTAPTSDPLQGGQALADEAATSARDLANHVAADAERIIQGDAPLYLYIQLPNTERGRVAWVAAMQSARRSSRQLTDRARSGACSGQ
jgi:hypothetical protein